MAPGRSRRTFLASAGGMLAAGTVGCVAPSRDGSGTDDTSTKSPEFIAYASEVPALDPKPPGPDAWVRSRRDVCNTARAPPDSLPGDGRLEGLWRRSAYTDRWTVPLLSDGQVLLNGPEQGGVTSLAASTGREVWSRSIESFLGIHGLSTSEIYAVFSTADGAGLGALDPTNGETRWHIPGLEPVVGVVPTASSLLVVGTHGRRLSALPRTPPTSIPDTSERWRYGPTARTESIEDVAVRDGRAFVVTQRSPTDVPSEGRVVAIDPTEGVQWERSLGAAGVGVVAGFDRLFVHLSEEVRAYSIEDGNEEWSVGRGSGHVSTGALGDGVLVYSDDRWIVGADAATGTERWRREMPAANGLPTVANDRVLVSTWGGQLGQLVTLDLSSGTTMRRIALDDESGVTRPSVAGGRAFVVTQRGTVFAFAPA